MAEEIMVSVGVTRNLGDFNSLRLDVQRRTELKPGETSEEAYDRAWAEVEAELEEQLAEFNSED